MHTVTFECFRSLLESSEINGRDVSNALGPYVYSYIYMLIMTFKYENVRNGKRNGLKRKGSCASTLPVFKHRKATEIGSKWFRFGFKLGPSH